MPGGQHLFSSTFSPNPMKHFSLPGLLMAALLLVQPAAGQQTPAAQNAALAPYQPEPNLNGNPL